MLKASIIMVNKTASAEHEERTFKNANNGPEFMVTEAAFTRDWESHACHNQKKKKG